MSPSSMCLFVSSITLFHFSEQQFFSLLMSCDLLCTNRGGIDRAVGVPWYEMIWPGFRLLLLPPVFACVQWYMPCAHKVREGRAGVAQEDRPSDISRAWRAVAVSQWWPNVAVIWLNSDLHEVSLVVSAQILVGKQLHHNNYYCSWH